MRPSRLTLAAAVASLAVLALLGVIGSASHTAASSAQKRLDTATPQATYDALVSTRARARTVVLVDRSARVSGQLYLESYLKSAEGEGRAEVGHRNLTSALLASGVAHDVIVVLPPSEWDGFLQFAASNPALTRVASGFRIREYGSAVVYTSPDLVRLPKERVMTVVRTDLAQGYPADFIERLTDPATSDVVVYQAGW